MNSLNPLHLIDSLLRDWASPRVRRLIHGLILLAVVVGGIWLAADGDWVKFAGALLAAFYAASNVANTDPDGVVLHEEDFHDGDNEAEGVEYLDDEPDDEDTYTEPIIYGSGVDDTHADQR
jgi:hypothetical protein